LEAGCALVGGETAEMPGFYSGDDYDMAGFAVGLVDEDKIINGSGVREGDLLIGIPSSGIHSNGYSLVRKLFFEQLGYDVNTPVDGLEGTLGEELIKPTRIYTKQVFTVLEKTRPEAIIHITGGGFIENIPRVIPEGLGVKISLGTWDIPPIFNIIKTMGHMSDEAIYNTLNMGIGLIFVVRPDACASVQRALETIGEKASVIGQVMPGEGVELI
jgi:phosphoribosylformylglycinamidine cyclo-ligase